MIIQVKRFFLFLILFSSIQVMGHPMPHSLLELNTKKDRIEVEIQLPVDELQLAVPFDLSNISNDLPALESKLKEYFLSHFKVKSGTEEWKVLVNNLATSREEKDGREYDELKVSVTLIPPSIENLQSFTLNYDGIIHQVVTHKIFVNLLQDWKDGKHQKTYTTIGIIELDIANNKIKSLDVALEKRSWWTGFKTMVELGMHHIAEGIDHLLFLLVLLLTAPLLAINKRWKPLHNIPQAFRNILKITLAFTIGHSVTLVLATLGWVSLPSQPVEVLIAISILITAIHAIKPLFANKEVIIAAGFGLIHGLAFATLLQDFGLDEESLGLSLLGFNVGIELMQLIIILIIMPWLLFLSTYTVYKSVRIAIAVIAILASLVWIFERATGYDSIFTEGLNKVSENAILLVPILILISITTYFFGKKVEIK